MSNPIKTALWAAVERTDVEIRALLMDADDKKTCLEIWLQRGRSLRNGIFRPLKPAIGFWMNLGHPAPMLLCLSRQP